MVTRAPTAEAPQGMRRAILSSSIRNFDEGLSVRYNIKRCSGVDLESDFF
jgi:hypothetical protein